MAKAKTTKKKSTKAKKIKFVDMPGLAATDAAIDGQQLLAAAQPVLVMLEKDLLARAEESPGITRALQERYEQEKAAERTADSFVQWQQRIVTQVAASWLISCVFVRTLEDRGLLGTPRIGGPGAMDSQKLFFELSPSLTERDYLLTVFRELSRFPAAKDLFDPQHSLLWKLSPSANAAKELLALFRTPDAQAPAFRFGQASTRFLGDLYQDLSEDVRKRYALLQTPDFIESFILDRTLEPAIERFGLDDTTLIDPTCGSGHFLLGAFDRLFEHRQRHEPSIDARQAAHKALDQVFGADINPYAVAIARFRMTLSYLDKAGFKKISDAPELPLHLVVADSLLHNPHQKQLDFEHQEEAKVSEWRRSDVFALEDEAAAKDVLHRQYAAVVGNPPYIVVKDAKLRERYRGMYPRSAAGKYSLAAPFCERFFQLGRSRGYIGQITANSFMKREFGKKLIQVYLPTVNLELIVNTSGAYIPGHGTPTVLLFGTHEEAQGREVLSVLAKRGEPSTPADPAKGEVWSSIAENWSELGFENDYISVANTKRDKLAQHPWSLAGGGATELKQLLEDRAEKRLSEITLSIGISCVTGEDDVYLLPAHAARRLDVGRTRPMVTGEFIRDWALGCAGEVVFPFDDDFNLLPESELDKELRHLWPYCSVISKRKRFGVPMLERGLTWYELQELYANKLRSPRSITFAFVATHNHFVLDRGGKVFNRTAPIIKLPADATEDDHLALLAYLNSSTACFWMKQVCQNRGAEESVVAHRDGDSVRLTVERAGTGSGGGYEFAGTPMKQMPIPTFDSNARNRAVELARRALSTADRIHELLGGGNGTDPDKVVVLVEQARAELVAIQEQIDWLVYAAFGLIDDEPALHEIKSLRAGLRPFEIASARKFEGAVDVTGTEGYELFAKYPSSVSSGDSATLDLAVRQIQQNKLVATIEAEEFKHRWAAISCAEHLQAIQEGKALQTAESAFEDEGLVILPQSMLSKTGADEVEGLPTKIKAASVPFLDGVTYSSIGLEKRKEWSTSWALQRLEDEGQEVSIPIPPKYGIKDFTSPSYYSLRGKLDVPKERFISYPGCESDEDGEPVYGWAGWDHMQRAQALAALYQKRKTEEGWDVSRLTPMLAGLLELIPWVKQWHNEPSDEFGGLRMGEYFEGFLDGECRQLGLTNDDLEAWRPAKKTRGSTKKAKAKKKDTKQ